MGYTPTPFNYTGTLPNQVQNDLNLANNNFTILGQAFVNNDPTTLTVKQSATVGGFQPSQKPAPNAIPVAGSDGKLDPGWLPTTTGTSSGGTSTGTTSSSGKLNMAYFDTSSTWVVPSGVTSILVIATGGGGGGGHGGSTTGGEGGYSAMSSIIQFPVVPGETIYITIGTGGSAGGGDGGDTIISGSLMTWTAHGGLGGRNFFNPSGVGLSGMSSLWGRGGMGGASGNNGENAPRYGAGGGGGGAGALGGAGAGGAVKIFWWA